MKLLIFKTNIANDFKVRKVNSLFAYTPEILDWSVDMEDRDKVLRVEASDTSNEHDIIELVENCGLSCEALPD